MDTYKVTFPATNDLGSFTENNIFASFMESEEDNALWHYNKAREHDGLPPVKELPEGTKFELNLSRAE